MKKYKSHLPVLQLIHSLYPYKSVLEFGCGMYSTKYFVDNCDSVTSIEMQSQEWYGRVKAKIISDKLNLLYMFKKEAIEWFKNSKDKYDLIFVDGTNRVDCVNASFGRADIIVLHDIGQKKIRHKRFAGIQLNNGYEFLLMNIRYPNTGIFTINSELAEKIKQHKKYVGAQLVI